jgi:hypothetical protein
LDQALQDLAVVPESSPDYAAAQSIKNAIEQDIQRIPPDSNKAERSCRKLVEAEEEFPSTIEYRWFGTQSKTDAASRTITVTVEYSAKNSTGLNYRIV